MEHHTVEELDWKHTWSTLPLRTDSLLLIPIVCACQMAVLGPWCSKLRPNLSKSLVEVQQNNFQLQCCSFSGESSCLWYLWDFRLGAQDLWKSEPLLIYNILCWNTECAGFGSKTQLWNDSHVLPSLCSNGDKCSNREKEKCIYYMSFAAVFLTWTAHFTFPFLIGSAASSCLQLLADSVLPHPVSYPQLLLTYLSFFSPLFSSFSASFSPSTFLSAQFPCLLLPLFLSLFTSSVLPAFTLSVCLYIPCLPSNSWGELSCGNGVSIHKLPNMFCIHGLQRASAESGLHSVFCKIIWINELVMNFSTNFLITHHSFWGQLRK